MSISSPPESTGVRASDAERDHYVELLGEHAAKGRLTVDELSERLERVWASRTQSELAVLVRDLPAIAEPASGQSDRAHERRDLRRHLASFVLVNLLLIAVWALTGAGYFWPIWPLLGWGVGIASHASETFLGRSVGLGPCGRRRTHGRAA